MVHAEDQELRGRRGRCVSRGSRRPQRRLRMLCWRHDRCTRQRHKLFTCAEEEECAKSERGRRLARAMRALAYGDPVSRTGPQGARATATTDGGAAVDFTGLTGGLHTSSAAQAIGFELCGAEAGSCRFVPGRMEGTRVLLAGDGRPATRVRYAWAESPVVNLYDETPLPVGSFELPITR